VKLVMKCIEKLRADLAAIGATLDEGDGYVLNCDAPSGYVWAATGCTAIPIQVRNNGGQSWVAQAIADERKDRLAMGLEKVTDPKELAGHRWELGDDTWGAPADAPDKVEWRNGSEVAK